MLLKGLSQKVKGLFYVLWDRADLGANGHKVMIAIPAGYDMKVEMTGKTCPSALS